MFFSVAWVEAYLLAFLSLFSFYHVWIQDRRGIFIVRTHIQLPVLTYIISGSYQWYFLRIRHLWQTYFIWLQS